MKKKLLFICVAVIVGYSNPHISFSQAFELMKENNSLITELSTLKSTSDISGSAHPFSNMTIPIPELQVPISPVNDSFDEKGDGFYGSGEPQTFTRYLQTDGTLSDDPYLDEYDQDIYVNNYILEWKDTLTSDTLGNSFILNLIGGSQGIYGSTFTAEILVKTSLGEISIATKDFFASCFYTLPFYDIYPRKMNVEITGIVPTIQSGDLLLLRIKVKSGAAGRIMYGTATGINYLKILGPLMTPSLSSPSNETINASVNPLLTWINSDGATSYYLQVSTQSDFSTTEFSDSTIVVTSQQVNDLEYSTKHYWRVKAKNFTGSTDWSEVWSFTTINPVGMNNLSSDKQIKIFPNPVNDVLYIEGVKNENTRVSIFSIDGTTLKQINDKGISQIYFGDLQKGTYILKIINTELIFIKKIIKD